MIHTPCRRTTSILLLASGALAQHLEYDAGVAGDPIIAPNPKTVGWQEHVTGQATRTDVSPDTDWGINAWQVNDPGQGKVDYAVHSIPDAGFVFTMEMRPIAESSWVVYDSGDLIVHNWFEIRFHVQGNDVLVSSEPGGANALLCVGAADGAYHRYDLVATYYNDYWLDLYYDGVLLGELRWTTLGLIEWGVLFSWGTRDGPGRARWHYVAFRARDHVGPMGRNYCGPAVPNSTGASARIEAQGAVAILLNDVTVKASDMPQNQLGYFLASQTQDFVAQPGGSQGNLCLGGNIARFQSQVQSTGNSGSFSIPVDLAGIPTVPPQAVQPGETWSFQAWFRDVNPMSTSNFTDGIAVTFF